MQVFRSRYALFALGIFLFAGSSSALEEAPFRRKELGPVEIPREALVRQGRFIKSGLRVETTEKGVKVSRRRFPSGGEPHGLEIPEHLGGGFLFYQSLAAGGAGVTAIYRAQDWTGPLRPLSRIPFPIERVSPGFDRFYVFGVIQQTAIDPDSGQFLPLDPLPSVVTVENLSFSFPGRALIQAPLVGVMMTSDFGRSWQRVPEMRAMDHGKRTSSRPGPGGKRHGLPQLSGGTFHQAAHSRAFAEVVTSGVLYEGVAYGIFEGRLYRLLEDATDGFRVVSGEELSGAEKSCVGVPGGETREQPPLFVCRGKETAVYRLSAPHGQIEAKTIRVGAWPKQARVLAAGEGGVLLSHSCDGTSTDRGCLLTSGRGSFLKREDRILPKTGKEPAYVVHGSQAWAVWVEGAKKTVVADPLLRRPGQKADRQTWKIPKEHTLSEFLLHGTLLPQGSLINDELALWVVLQDRLLGFRLGASKEPSFGSVQRPSKRVLFDGPRAMLWGAAGFAKRSEDGGQVFEELSLPFRSGDADLAQRNSATQEVAMGCSEVGCVLGSLIRLGYGVLPEVEEVLPAAVPRAPEGPGRFRFVCTEGRRATPSGKSSESGYPSFWEAPAPLAPVASAKFSAAFPTDHARLYAYGPAEGGWSRGAGAQLLFIDPWAFGPVERSALSPRFFDSSADAQARLGLLDRAVSHQSIQLDPDGKHGVIELRSRDESELLAFVSGQPLRRFFGAQELGLRHLVSAVYAEGELYGGFLLGREFLITRFSAEKLEVIGRYPLGEGGPKGVNLVRTTEGQLGVSMEADDGLIVYPVALDGELGEPLMVREMRDRPEACSADATGFIVERELSVAPYVESLDGENLRLSGIRARYIVGHGAPCLEALTARAGEALHVKRGAWGREAVPLNVLSTTRIELMCE